MTQRPYNPIIAMALLIYLSWSGGITALAAQDVQKNKMYEIFLLIKDPVIKIDNPKKKDKNKGINISAKGIRVLNISSCVKEIEIQ